MKWQTVTREFLSKMSNRLAFGFADQKESGEYYKTGLSKGEECVYELTLVPLLHFASLQYEVFSFLFVDLRFFSLKSKYVLFHKLYMCVQSYQCFFSPSFSYMYVNHFYCLFSLLMFSCLLFPSFFCLFYLLIFCKNVKVWSFKYDYFKLVFFILYVNTMSTFLVDKRFNNVYE